MTVKTFSNSEITKLLFQIDSCLEKNEPLLPSEFPPIKPIISRIADVLFISEERDDEVFEIFTQWNDYDWLLVEQIIQVCNLKTRKSLMEIVIKVIQRNCSDDSFISQSGDKSNEYTKSTTKKAVQIYKYLNPLMKIGLRELEMGNCVGLDLVTLLYKTCFVRMDFYVKDILPILIYACRISESKDLLDFIRLVVKDHPYLHDDLKALKSELSSYSTLSDKISAGVDLPSPKTFQFRMKRKHQDLGILFSSLEISKKFKVEEITDSLKLLKFNSPAPLSPIVEEEEEEEVDKNIIRKRIEILPRKIFTKLNPENAQIVLYSRNRWLPRLPNGR